MTVYANSSGVEDLYEAWEALYPEIELDGARAVGIHTVAFNNEEGAVADTYIQDFADLQSLPLLNE